MKEKSKQPKQYPPLQPVYGSHYCQYSVIENKLAVLYENQEKIYAAVLDLIAKTESI